MKVFDYKFIVLFIIAICVVLQDTYRLYYYRKNLGKKVFKAKREYFILQSVIVSFFALVFILSLIRTIFIPFNWTYRDILVTALISIILFRPLTFFNGLNEHGVIIEGDSYLWKNIKSYGQVSETSIQLVLDTRFLFLKPQRAVTLKVKKNGLEEIETFINANIELKGGLC